MQDFSIWLQLGFAHILDINGYDHLLFLLVLTAPYTWKQSKSLFWLITAFTFGHSLSLALSTLGFVQLKSVWIELFIAITILLTAIQNLWSLGSNQTLAWQWMYGTTTFFGLIHGLGFSGTLRSLLGSGSQIILPLFAFNVGLELGQILWVLLLLLLSVLLISLIKLPNKYSTIAFSSIGILLSGKMIYERILPFTT
jgi:hypothetical protein